MIGGGGLQAGRAFVDLVPRLKDGFGNDVERQVNSEQSRIGGVMGKLGGLAGKALIGGIGAAVAGGIKGVIDFAGFERSMNEVFTLLPGISGPAMAAMTDQVKGFATEFGVLPNEVVPALYQSISAGVPAGNVFEFLETAQKAAKGGVTELTTAVDGISSVVNAYGSEVVDATKASDLMFTAVRLGKTNFQELSASLFNVTPTAAGLGVKFEDLTAALAAMTSQGVPTSVATTQLRQLFVELSKEGGKTADTFEGLAGKSFKEFIASGGNTAQALELMLAGAEDLDVGVNDLFGSVDAGSAALALAGSETFTKNLTEMGDAAGATQAAYETMDRGIGPVFDRIKARLAVLSIEIGERIAPLLERAFVAGEAIFKDVARVIGTVVDAFKILSGDDGAQGFGEVMDNLLGNSGEYVDLFRRIGETIRTVAAFIKDNLKPILIGLGAAVLVAAGPFVALGAALVALYVKSETFRDIVNAVATFLTTVVAPAVATFVGYLVEQFANLVTWVQTHWAAIQEAISHVVTVVRTIIEVAVAAIELVWRYFGDTILAVITTAWDSIRAVVEFGLDFIRGIIEFVVAIINGDWGDAWAAIVGILSSAWDTIKTLVGGAIEVVRTLIVDGLVAAKDLALAQLDAIVGFFAELPGRLVGAAGNLFQWIIDKATEMARWVLDKIDTMLGPLDELLGKVRDVQGFVGIGGPGVYEKLTGNKPPGAASGAELVGSGLTWVGEEGPELLDLSAGSRVIPLGALGRMIEPAAEGRGGPAVVIGEAHFEDEVDLDLLMSRASFATTAGRL